MSDMYFRKNFRLHKNEMDIINEVKEEFNYNETEALKYIIRSYKNSELVDLISKRLKEDNRKFFERLRWASSTAEKNSILMLDGLNSILLQSSYMDSETLYQDQKAKILIKSEEEYKRKIEHFKQEKDNRENKTKIVE